MTKRNMSNSTNICLNFDSGIDKFVKIGKDLTHLEMYGDRCRHADILLPGFSTQHPAGGCYVVALRNPFVTLTLTLAQMRFGQKNACSLTRDANKRVQSNVSRADPIS